MKADAASCAQISRQESFLDDVEVDLSKISGPVHFVGIGGIGMSALARILLAQKLAVSGSDREHSEITDQLAALGAKIFIGHSESNAQEAGALVVSTAITADNPELKRARQAGIPVWHRSHLLKYICRSSKLIAVSGTHGKTTTTAMVAQVLLDASLDPSIVVGGIFNRIGANAVAGNGGYFVAEADESDGTHADMQSYMAVLTNVEADHLENYPGGISQIHDLMTSFVTNAEHAAVICTDDPGCRVVIKNIAPRKDKKVITYGKHDSAEKPLYSYRNLPGTAMAVIHEGKELGQITLCIPGEHNKENALAAVAVGLDLGAPFDVIARSLSTFSGVDRRFQIIGEAKSVIVVDDYAHHPTEVKATLAAARQYIQELERKSKQKRRLVAIFQPHQPGRLKDFWQEFRTALKEADIALVADIYIARGGEIEGVNSKRFVGEIDHDNAHYIPGKVSDLADKIVAFLATGDIVLTIGAGDITNVGPQLLKVIEKTEFS